uniref:G_PROTEIN_RECEP_F1_2 domain-containing protein n=1 Tax=Parastrongyloides trichosuri TaxID=131310 RepID=A0A0N4Z6P1_PARTI
MVISSIAIILHLAIIFALLINKFTPLKKYDKIIYHLSLLNFITSTLNILTKIQGYATNGFIIIFCSKMLSFFSDNHVLASFTVWVFFFLYNNFSVIIFILIRYKEMMSNKKISYKLYSFFHTFIIISYSLTIILFSILHERPKGVEKLLLQNELPYNIFYDFYGKRFPYYITFKCNDLKFILFTLLFIVPLGTSSFCCIYCLYKMFTKIIINDMVSVCRRMEKEFNFYMLSQFLVIVILNYLPFLSYFCLLILNIKFSTSGMIIFGIINTTPLIQGLVTIICLNFYREGFFCLKLFKINR